MRPKRATINDVARRAEVSKATVSAVINDRSTVRDSTRAHVLRTVRERPTAVSCFNDLVAVGLLRALAELQIRVADEVSVIGYDDTSFLGYMPLPLSRVRIPRREMIEWATQLLIQHIESREPIPPKKVLLEPELVIRDSTRPCRRRGGRGGNSRGGAQPSRIVLHD